VADATLPIYYKLNELLGIGKAEDAEKPATSNN